MGSFFQTLGYYLGHPEVLMYPVAEALWFPAVTVLAVSMCYIIYESGRFAIEMFTRDRRRSLPRIEESARRARYYLTAGAKNDAVSHLEAMSTNWLHLKFVGLLRTAPDLGRARLAKILTEVELIASKRLDRTRVWIRLAPILGLMTTLIPISPALVGLAKGDMKTLSANLILAFSTTIIGLLISALAFLISHTRERIYMQDIGDIEYALELMEV
jgi:biopolymer transport protein ExbB/TolQ